MSGGGALAFDGWSRSLGISATPPAGSSARIAWELILALKR